MALVPVDLPSPLEMRARWAAHSAVMAALGYGDSANADRGPWYYDDGGGNWAELHRLDGDRAVLLGHDHEYSDTYYNLAAEYFGEDETDLLAGAPDWWGEPVRATEEPGRWIGFVYGYADGEWQRVPYDLHDGFTSVNPPLVSDERCRELIAAFTKRSEDDAAIGALIAADGAVTEEQVAAVVDESKDAAAGVVAARRFLD
ncbi:proteophosphoglycan 5 [Umezawaea endophytica]|uniref:Proteophosphoglycan 5 n=1 Tax=Umezawaea endophytica TaxID=1654476 RepID=A0A9X2VV98_9PSEU|nr:proteophosphoglycan 5 [Umezawaea endophytica]MCS7483296.1 proteophosphoglycan 5 [Umezawaea endophytica]